MQGVGNFPGLVDLAMIQIFLGTGQYFCEYRTENYAVGPMLIFVLPSYVATGYFECLVYGATVYFNVQFQLGQIFI